MSHFKFGLQDSGEREMPEGRQKRSAFQLSLENVPCVVKGVYISCFKA